MRRARIIVASAAFAAIVAVALMVWTVARIRSERSSGGAAEMAGPRTDCGTRESDAADNRQDTSRPEAEVPATDSAAVTTVEETSPAEEAPDSAAILRAVAATNRNNRERLATWRGSTQVTVVCEDDAGVSSVNRYSGTFFYDQAGNSQRHTWRQVAGLERKGGRLVETELPNQDNLHAVTPDGFVTLQPIWQESNAVEPLAVIWPFTERTASELMNLFHPMSSFAVEAKDPVALLTGYADPATDSQTPVSVAAAGDLVTVEVTEPEGVRRYCYDMARGGNLVRCRFDNPKGAHCEDLRTYREVDGVWVPVTTTRTYCIAGPDGSMRKVTSCVEFSGSQVNQPADAGEFELENLGIPRGTMVVDMRTRVKYRYGSEDPPERLPGSAAEEQPCVAVEPSAAEPVDAVADADAEPVEAPAATQSASPRTTRRTSEPRAAARNSPAVESAPAADDERNQAWPTAVAVGVAAAAVLVLIVRSRR